jgi:polyvinyl alcohol dehydrogenase (cytochrome)
MGWMRLILVLPCLAVLAGRTAVAAIVDGAGLYSVHCAACHDHPHDRIPPRFILNRFGPDQVEKALTAGPMRQQAAGLSAQEIQALVSFLTGNQAGAVAADPQANLCAKPAGPIELAGSQWNGWGRDLENTRFQPDPGLEAADVPRLKLKWAFAYPGSDTVGQPVVIGDRLFVSSVTGRVFSLDARTGCTYWSFEADGPVKSAITVGPADKEGGGRNLAYFGDMAGFAYAIDAMTGQLVWKVKPEIHKLVQLRGSVKLYQGRLYVPISSDEETASADPAYPCCTFRGGVAALDAATGRLIWRAYTIAETPAGIGKNPAGTDIFGPAGASVWNSPTIDAKRRRLYVGTGNSYSLKDNGATDAVAAFDLDTGKRLWVTQATKNDIWVICQKPGTGNCPKDIGPDFDFGSSTVLETAANGKQVLLAGQKAGAVYAFDPDDNGKILWKAQLGVGGAYGGIEHGIAAEGDKVYVPISDVMATVAVDPAQLVPHKAGGLSALNILTGRAIWHTPAPKPVCSWGQESCFAAQAASIAVIPGIVFSGSLDGHIRAFASDTGAIVWTFDTARSFRAVNGVAANGGAVIGYGQTIAGGTLYVNSGGGYHGPPGNALLAFTVDGK